MNRQHNHLLFLLFCLLLATLACNLPLLGEEAVETPVVTEVTAAAASADELAEEQPAVDQQLQGWIDALAASFDARAAFYAVLAALERGYALDQIVAGIEGRHLGADGFILAADGSRVTPTKPPAGLVDLSELEAASEFKGRFHRPEQQIGGFSPEELYNIMEQDISQSEAESETDLPLLMRDEFKVVTAILMLHRTGYSIEQIINAIIFDSSIQFKSIFDEQPFTFEGLLQCAILFEPGAEATPIVPVDDTLCRQELIGQGDLPAETTSEESSDPILSSDGEGGDVEAFCDLYSLLIADQVAWGDTISAAFCDDCDSSDLYIQAEDSAAEFYQKMVPTAPTDLRPVFERIAATSFRGLYSSSETLTELEADLFIIDNYADDVCGVSFDNLSEESE